ncbi:MAG: phosphotransferase [Pseudomonadales bacterium]|nr:phosphotransferase [Pseudomonadales bacterium]
MTENISKITIENSNPDSRINPKAKVEVLKSIDDLTVDWLRRAVNKPINTFTANPVGTGQTSGTFSVVTDCGDNSYILKLADTDPAVRFSGDDKGLHERETFFYSEVSSQLPLSVLPTCYISEYDDIEGYFTLLFDAVSPARVGDQLVGSSINQAKAAVKALAKIQASVYGSEKLARDLAKPSIVNSRTLTMLLPVYYERFGSCIPEAYRLVIKRFCECFDTWTSDDSIPKGIEHGDYRLDNMLFGQDDSTNEITVVDWATLKWGALTNDLAFYIGGNLEINVRREHERMLVGLYHQELVKNGVEGFSLEECWRGYLLGSFTGVLMAVGAPMVVEQTDRGDQMFMTMLKRHCQQVIDLNALDVLNETHTRAVTVDPANEYRHESFSGHSIGNEKYWNESWYLDVINEDGSIGAYVRIGLVPNLKKVVFTAYIVREGRESLSMVDYEAPFPDTGTRVKTENFQSDLIVEEALKRMRWTFSGMGECHVDPAETLRHRKGGREVQVEVDLCWQTEGIPYQYPMTTRYELPCHVVGNISIGDESFPISGPGQRDHSWGARDWWSMDWTWISAHLEDQTRLQAVELRYPGLPPMAAGYQQKNAVLQEIQHIQAEYHVPEDRLPTKTKTNIDVSGLGLEYEPIAYGPLRIDSTDGRICEFPRAMARVTTSDGRKGLGWIEWGHNISQQSNGPASFAKLQRALEGALKRLMGFIPESIPRKAIDTILGKYIIAALFRALPSKINARVATEVDAVVRFKINNGYDNSTSIYDIVLAPFEKPKVVSRSVPSAANIEPIMTISTSAADLFSIGLGYLDATTAGMSGILSFKGDQDFIPIFAGLLSPDKTPLLGNQTSVGGGS